MRTQLGIIKMADGGEVPAINVSDDVIKKIRRNVGLKKLYKSQNFGTQGLDEVEFDHKLCYHDKYKDKLFGICQVKMFDGQKMVKDRFRVYCFDFNGNEIPFDQKSECIDAFYENCYIIKQLLN
jgi:hypothetical protein